MTLLKPYQIFRSFITLSLCSLMLAPSLLAQELNCDVNVTYENIQPDDPNLFKDLEQNIRDFMNDTVWTRDEFQPQERINCSIYIDIVKEISLDQFSATATIKSSRPVFNSDYKTVVFDLVDRDFEFKYDQFITLSFKESEYSDNLTSMLAYYAYTIIGLDYDTFQRGSGLRHFKKAQDIVNSASSSPFPGWTANNTNNRGELTKYWLNENLLNPKYRNIRDAYYDYHRNGLDHMYDDPQIAYRSTIAAVKRLKIVNQQRRNLPMIYTFFNAKSDEITGLFSDAPTTFKTQIVNLVTELDPINSRKYEAILK